MSGRIPSRWRSVLAIARTFAIGTVGGLLFDWLGLPAAYLSGPLVAVSIAAIAGYASAVPGAVANVVFVVVGISLGAGVSPEALAGIMRWPLSLAFLLVYLLIVQVSVQVFFRRVAAWSRETAFFAAIPGAFTYVMALGVHSRADIRQVAIAQSLRVFILIAVTPGVLVALQVATPRPIERVAADPTDLLIMFVAAVLGGYLFHLLRIPAAWLMGAMAASAAIHATGIVAAGLPPEILLPGIIGLAAIAGTRFEGTDLVMLRRSFIASIGGFLVAIAVTLVFAGTVSLTIGMPIGQTLLAFAPGAIDAMTLMAFVLGLDAAYVAVHHLVRFFAIAIAAPIMGRSMLGGETGSRPDQGPPG